MRRICLLLGPTLLGAVLVAPGTAAAAGIIGSLSISPDSVRGGATSQGTVALAFPDPAATTVLLFSGDTSVATVPATATVPAGATSVSFPIATNAAAPPTIVAITGWVGNTPRTANLSVNPATPSGPSVSFVPASIVAGQNATGTVRFTAAMTQGAVVQLSSSNPAVAQVPAETVVSATQSSGTFNLSTAAVSAPTTVTITATWFSITRTTTVTITPGAPPAADTVKIKKASWKAGLLRIEATSTNPNAILGVYSATGSFLFNLTNNGGGSYSDQRGFVTNPVAISVRSNFGGSATATLTN